MVDVNNESITEPAKKENTAEPTNPTVTKTETVEAPKETQDQINWKAFRDQREKERKEKIALEQEAQKKSQEIAALKAAMEAIVSKPEPASQSSDVDETEEQRVQKQINAAVDAALKEKEAREAQDKAKREAQEVPARLEQSFSDFNTVCSTENLDYLEYHHPGSQKHLKASLTHSTNGQISIRQSRDTSQMLPHRTKIWQKQKKT